jgi:hypothetical protein
MTATMQADRIESDSLEIGGVGVSSQLQERFGSEIDDLMKQIGLAVKSHQIEKAVGDNQELKDVMSSFKDLNVSPVIDTTTVQLANTISTKGSDIQLG